MRFRVLEAVIDERILSPTLPSLAKHLTPNSISASGEIERKSTCSSSSGRRSRLRLSAKY